MDTAPPICAFPAQMLGPVDSSSLTSTDAGTMAFTVLSYNIWGIFNSKDRVPRIQALAETKLHNYDILCLQESFSPADFEIILNGMNKAWADKIALEEEYGGGGGHWGRAAKNASSQSQQLSPSSSLTSLPASASNRRASHSRADGSAAADVSGSPPSPSSPPPPPKRFNGIHSVSSFVGPGLGIITRFPIMSHNFYRFPLQGAPELVYHGDYFCSKGVTVTRLSLQQCAFSNVAKYNRNQRRKAASPRHTADGNRPLDSALDADDANDDDLVGDDDAVNTVTSVVVYNTHLVAQYEKYSNLPSFSAETYAAVRLSQAAFLADIIETTSAKDDNVLICGDFNCAPASPEFALLSAVLSQRSVQTKQRMEREAEGLHTTHGGAMRGGGGVGIIAPLVGLGGALPMSPNPSQSSMSMCSTSLFKRGGGEGSSSSASSCLIKALPTDMKTNITYSLENPYNSSPTSYFQLLSMVEDLPVQLDHILYRHHYLAPKSSHSNNNTNINHAGNNPLSIAAGAGGDGAMSVSGSLSTNNNKSVSSAGALHDAEINGDLLECGSSLYKQSTTDDALMLSSSAPTALIAASILGKKRDRCSHSNYNNNGNNNKGKAAAQSTTTVNPLTHSQIPTPYPHRKLVMRMVPLLFAQSEGTREALLSDMSPLFKKNVGAGAGAHQSSAAASATAAGTSSVTIRRNTSTPSTPLSSALSANCIADTQPQGVVMHFHNPHATADPLNNKGMPMSDHWGVACRFVLAPMDPYYDPMATSSASTLHDNGHGVSNGSTGGTPTRPTGDNASTPLRPPPSSFSFADFSVVKRSLLETFAFPKPHQFMCESDYKLANRGRRFEGVSLGKGRGAYDKAILEAMLSKCTVLAVERLKKLRGGGGGADQNDLSDSSRNVIYSSSSAGPASSMSRLHSASTSNHVGGGLLSASSVSSPFATPVERLIAAQLESPLTLAHTQNGPDMYYFCKNRDNIVILMNAILKAKVKSLQKGRKHCMKTALRNGIATLGIVFGLTFLGAFTSIFEFVLSLFGANGAAAVEWLLSIVGISAHPATHNYVMSTGMVAFTVFVATICGIAGIIYVLIGKLQREVDGLVLGNMTQSLDVLQGCQEVDDFGDDWESYL